MAKWIAGVLAVAVSAYLLDRALLKMEERGWIYWRKRHGSGAGVGNALHELNAFFQPSERRCIEAQQEWKEQRQQDNEAGRGVAGGPHRADDRSQSSTLSR